MIERALASADAAEIEAQRGEAAVHELIVELVDDRVVHRAAELRMRMQHDGDRRVLLPRGVVPALDASCGAGENDFRHCDRPRSFVPLNNEALAFAVVPAGHRGQRREWNLLLSRASWA